MSTTSGSTILSYLFDLPYKGVESTLRAGGDLTIASSRYITSPLVNKLVNSLAFLPPPRSNEELSDLETMQNHSFVQNGVHRISYVTFKPDDDSDKRTVRHRPLQRRCILFSHGNGSDIIAMADFCSYWADVYGMDCVCYDYLGYGLSSNINEKTLPSENGCYLSLKLMVEKLKNEYDTIYLVGQSLGTGICVDYCAKYGWSSPVVLISPYKSIVRVVADSCVSSILDSSFNTMEKIPNLRCPVKIFHGDSDTLIPITHGREIYNALPIKTHQPVWLNGVGHNDILNKIKTEHLYEFFRSE